MNPYTDRPSTNNRFSISKQAVITTNGGLSQSSSRGHRRISQPPLSDNSVAFGYMHRRNPISIDGFKTKHPSIQIEEHDEDSIIEE